MKFICFCYSVLIFPQFQTKFSCHKSIYRFQKKKVYSNMKKYTANLWPCKRRVEKIHHKTADYSFLKTAWKVQKYNIPWFQELNFCFKVWKKYVIYIFIFLLKIWANISGRNHELLHTVARSIISFKLEISFWMERWYFIV